MTKAAYQPCFIFQYVAFIDTDELLMPGRNFMTLPGLLENLEKPLNLSAKYDAISFRNLHLLATAEETLPSKGKFILNNTERALNPLPHGNGPSYKNKERSCAT